MNLQWKCYLTDDEADTKACPSRKPVMVHLTSVLWANSSETGDAAMTAANVLSGLGPSENQV